MFEKHQFDVDMLGRFLETYDEPQPKELKPEPKQVKPETSEEKPHQNEEQLEQQPQLWDRDPRMKAKIEVTPATNMD